MGYVTAMAPCFSCGRLFSFNPVHVPSIIVNGRREPICRSCVTRANAMRERNGMPLIVPLDDAYDACDESEI
jgi:hypothetical protein